MSPPRNTRNTLSPPPPPQHSHSFAVHASHPQAKGFSRAYLPLLPALLSTLSLLLTPQPIAADTVSFPEPSRIEALADSLYACGEFDAAALEYKRALYYSGLTPDLYLDSSGTLVRSDSPVSLRVFEGVADSIMTRLKLSVSLYRNGERNEADSILYSIDGPVVRMVRAVILIEEADPYLAARQIDSSTCAALGAGAYRLRGWSYLEAKDFESAAREFGKAGDDSLARTLLETKLRLKNPSTARWLSLLPGLGETYAGRPLFGLWAFLVNAGDTYLVIANILAGRYVDAILAYSFLWQRFYSGSMTNADKFAKQWNEREYKKTLEPIRYDYGEKATFRLDLAALESLDTLAKNTR